MAAAKVNAEIIRALADPKMRERRRTAKWGKVVTSSGAKVE